MTISKTLSLANRNVCKNPTESVHYLYNAFFYWPNDNRQPPGLMFSILLSFHVDGCGIQIPSTPIFSYHHLRLINSCLLLSCVPTVYTKHQERNTSPSIGIKFRYELLLKVYCATKTVLGAFRIVSFVVLFISEFFLKECS